MYYVPMKFCSKGVSNMSWSKTMALLLLLLSTSSFVRFWKRKHTFLKHKINLDKMMRSRMSIVRF